MTKQHSTKPPAVAPICNPHVKPSAAPPFSQDAIALKFVAKYSEQLRYVAAWKKWYVFNGRVWIRDMTNYVTSLVRDLCREEASIARKRGDTHVAAKTASRGTVEAVRHLAEAEQRFAAQPEDWDRDPFLLNTPNGAIDLRTGQAATNDHAGLHTKTTAVAPDAECQTPHWKNFLNSVTIQDGELQLYLQRFAGYVLTGSTREQAMFFLYGPGGNGKGVFLNTLTSIMQDYACVANVETFAASKTRQHSEELARLHGARLVVAQETESGQNWAEARIKLLTGGDPITARHLYQESFTYLPQFKLVVAGNQKPGLTSVDEGIRRRLNVIPFIALIRAEDRDPDLAEKLKAEWPGILAWAIQGCLMWQKHGLLPPPAITAATSDYLEAEDLVGRWLADCCTIGPALRTPSADLFDCWKKWAEASNEPQRTHKRFSQALADRGFQSYRVTGGRAGFVGLAIKSQLELAVIRGGLRQ